MSDFDTLIGLVSQYSPSGQERGAVEWLVTRMWSLGYDASFVDEAGNAVGILGEVWHRGHQLMMYLPR